MRIKGDGINRFKIFTHSDLDGMGGAILAKVAFGNKADINIEMTSTFEKAINRFLDNDSDLPYYKALYIVDLSISEDLANKIESVCSSFNIKLNLFDHHNTSINLNNRSWCTVIESETTCGTSLFYDFLLKISQSSNKNLYNTLLKYQSLVSAITMFDTATWAKNDNFLSYQLAMLLRALAKKDRFIDRFVNNPSTKLTPEELIYIGLEIDKAASFVFSRKLKSFVANIDIPNLGNYDVIICYASDFYLEMFSTLFDYYPNINIAIVINLPFGISYRLRDNTPNVDLSKISEFFGGGGHVESAGSSIPPELVKNLTKSIFQSYGANVSFI